MPYKPTKAEISYLQELRKRKIRRDGVWVANNVINAIKCPEAVYDEYAKQWGENWHRKKDNVAKFMVENPQWVVTRPG